MFSFEEWSQEIYRLTDLIEVCKSNHEDPSTYEKELQTLWDELIQQEDEQLVQFLKQILDLTRDVMKGKQERAELETVVDQMRESVLN